ncbi:MAG: hypothetical protein J2P49_08235, partial [Methylocapsa sp.]|nr:hypothetical protein [Methylocapsa sp.]
PFLPGAAVKATMGQVTNVYCRRRYYRRHYYGRPYAYPYRRHAYPYYRGYAYPYYSYPYYYNRYAYSSPYLGFSFGWWRSGPAEAKAARYFWQPRRQRAARS